MPPFLGWKSAKKTTPSKGTALLTRFPGPARESESFGEKSRGHERNPMVPFGPWFISLELREPEALAKITESPCGKRDQRKKPRAVALGLVRKPVSRPVSRPKKELPERNPLRTTPPALSRRKCFLANELASSILFRSPQNRKEPPTELRLRSLRKKSRER